MKRFLIIFVVPAILGGFIAGREYFLNQADKTKPQTEMEGLVSKSADSRQIIDDSKITLFAVGDVMLSRGVEYMMKKEQDWKLPFLKIADDLKKADILFGNLEGPISDKGYNVGSIYSFRANPEAIEGLTYAGFDVLSVANNHMFDYGREALEDTLKRLKEAGIGYVGGGFNENEAYSLLIKEIKGIKIAFLAYTNLGSSNWAATPQVTGIAWLTEKRLKGGIKDAKEKADIVIVSFHMGDEYEKESNAEQKYFFRLAIDQGADLVLGHHPHVAQEIEKYKNGWIAYSLGNFVFDQEFSEETMEGMLLELAIRDKKIEEITPRKIIISPAFQPYFE